MPKTENTFDEGSVTTFLDFMEAIEAWRRIYPEQRYGQAYVNVLRQVRPIIADSLEGSSSDPWEAKDPDDERVLRAITHTHESWEILV